MLKFYKCNECGKVLILNEEVKKCNWTELVAGEVEASVEKHKPVVKVNGKEVEVCVGSVVHPMSEEHHIAWVAMETKKGYQVRNLCHTCEPIVKMTVEEGDELVAVYAYCNLHGVWKA